MDCRSACAKFRDNNNSAVSRPGPFRVDLGAYRRRRLVDFERRTTNGWDGLLPADLDELI